MRLFFLPLGITTSRSCSQLQLQRPISQDEKSSRDCTTKYELQYILLTQRSAPSPQVPIFEVKPRRRRTKLVFPRVQLKGKTVLSFLQCCLYVGLV